MWEQYETPEEKRAKQTHPKAAFDPAEFSSTPVRAAGANRGVGLGIGLVGMVAVIAVGVGMASSSDDAFPEDDSVVCYDDSLDDCADEFGFDEPDEEFDEDF